MKSKLAKVFDWGKTKVAKKTVFFFSEGSEDDSSLFGNKGSKLCGMVRLGLPVPPGFIVSTQSCNEYLSKGSLDTDLHMELRNGVRELELQTGRNFSANVDTVHTFPLLFSIRSGAPVSMPGMMSTILNVGMNDAKFEQLAAASNNRRFALDCYRRFLQMFGDVVLGMDKEVYEKIIQEAKERRGIENDAMLRTDDLQFIVDRFKQLVTIPDDPWIQLEMAIEAIFKSWNTPRARKYRDIHNISDDMGTAVIVQSMVFGNMNSISGSGVVFTRNPSTGDKEMYGEYLWLAEGEDVVSGIRTPVKLDFLQLKQPTVYDTLVQCLNMLETHFKDAQDVEFTVENGILHILQTRTAKRSAPAAIAMAVAMVKEKLITEREAILRLDPKQMDALLHPMVDPLFRDENSTVVRSILLGKGLPASAGAVKGKIVFECSEAERCASDNEPCILCRDNTSADDISGLKAACGVLTMRGGMTSHAAVVMRGMGKSAVTAASNLILDLEKKELRTKDGKHTLHAGDIITIDGSSGLIFTGDVPMISSTASEEFRTVLQWSDKYKRLQVLANADTPEEVSKAAEFGAEGLGLCRTEHMFFSEDRITLLRQLILSDDMVERKNLLNRMIPYQQRDFLRIFRVMPGRQITVRLLDPPMHEFLPSPSRPGFEEALNELCSSLHMDVDDCRRRIFDLQEVNPMLGFRGCRLGVVYPEIVEMQVAAIIGAAIEADKEGLRVGLQIMIPLVFSEHEVDYIIAIINRVRRELCRMEGVHEGSLFLQIGSMLETPRACLRADRITSIDEVEFLSFGSNDLTQMMLGLSRDDTQQFMPHYLKHNIIAFDPFECLDTQGVGAMVDLAVRKARKTDPNIKMGICGEHGADASSIRFFDSIGLDYISCNPYQVPGAKVAAAQSHIWETSSGGSQKRNLQQISKTIFGLS